MASPHDKENPETEKDIWTILVEQSRKGNLFPVVKRLPISKLIENFILMYKLLLLVCSDNDIDTLTYLLSIGVRIELFNCHNMRFISHYICTFYYKPISPFIVELLLSNYSNYKVLIPWRINDRLHGRDMEDTSLVFISNGFCLRNLVDQGFATEKMIECEARVKSCRDVIIVLLGLKKRRHSMGYSAILPKLDRFLIKQELAVAIWSTRKVFKKPAF